MNTTRPLLSIGMIVKNEIRCLKKCLDALAPLRAAVPCQLVIADTGSTDGTRELAAEYADVLFDFEWINDFAAARNAVLDRCTGVWHLQVDADEYLDGDFSRLVEFLTSPIVEEGELGLVIQRNYNSDEMLEDDYADFYVRRMLRVDCGSRYQGIIHEMPEIRDGFRTIFFDRLIFHHDGYVGKRGKGKKERNLPLLEKELAENPGELRRIVQCLESCGSLRDLRKYAKMAVDVAQKDGISGWRQAAFHDVLMRTAHLGYPETPLWAEKARTLFPDSILIGVGGSYGMICYYYKIGELEKVCEELKLYHEALARFDAGEYDKRELQVTCIAGTTQRERRTARALQAETLGKLERWQELRETLAQWKFTGRCGEGMYPQFMFSLLNLWQHGGPGAEELLRLAVDSLEEEEYEKFAKMCRQAFAKPEEPEDPDAPPLREKWKLFATLGDGCDLGRFGLLMEAETAREVERLLFAVEDLGFLPREALMHALSLGAALPGGFFRMKAEEIGPMAEGLAGLLVEEPEKAMAFCPKEEDPGRALWSYTIACELVGRMDWEKKGDVALFDFFCDRAERYIALFFGETIRREENWNFLPLLARYAAHCVKARTARNAGDELGYIRGFREALKEGPGMKKMVNWLLDEAKTMADRTKQEASPELLRLAEQVKAILAQYPADHPAVQEIRESPMYQQVAYLIEE